jgi:hypothetical protein
MMKSNVMQRNSSKYSAPKKAEAPGGEKAPMGQCPLCYTENPYSRSLCSECNLPLPWAKAEMHEREPCGECLKCRSENPYTSLNCWSCGARLPWANAVSPLAQQVGHAALNGMNGATPSSNGYHQPVAVTGINHLRMPPPAHVHDEPNQIVDAVSLVCPPLGFIAYVTLLGQLPRQAVNAARFALYGLGVWVFLLLVFLVMPNLKLGKFSFGKRSAKSVAKKMTSVNTNPESAGEFYQ